MARSRWIALSWRRHLAVPWRMARTRYVFRRVMNRAIYRELLILAYPMVVSQGAFAVMIFTDRYFMSLVSPTHMGASLGGGVASFFCMSLICN